MAPTNQKSKSAALEVLRRAVAALADVLFPETETERLLRRMTLPELRAKVRRRDGFGDLRATALLPYADPAVRALVRALKYRGDLRAARLLGELLHDELFEELAERGPTGAPIVLVPVPLAPARERKRGWNQAELLARALAAASPGGYDVRTDILARTRDAPSQTSLASAKERASNVRGAFAVAAGAAVPARCIVIDDVVTTGSTLREAAGALRRAGAREILLVAAAH